MSHSSGFPSTHDGLIWYYRKALDALFRILVVEIPTDVSLSQQQRLMQEAYLWTNITRHREELTKLKIGK